MRRFRLRVLVGAAVVVAVLSVALPVLASHRYWAVDDSCSTTGTTYFYPEGPAGDWYVHSGNGYEGYCHMWTNPHSEWRQRANWYLPISTNYNGRYNVRIWNDCDGHFENTAVKYQRLANGTAGGVTQTYTFNQGGAPCDSIQHVGQGQFNGSSGGYMRAHDRSSDTTNPIGIDHLRYVPVAH